MRGTTGGTADSAADRVGDLDQKARRRPAAGEVAEADHLDELARKGRGVTLIKGDDHGPAEDFHAACDLSAIHGALRRLRLAFHGDLLQVALQGGPEIVHQAITDRLGPLRIGRLQQAP
jgi:hypothetical protein